MASSTFQNLRAALATAVTTRLTTDLVTDVTVFQYPPMGQVTREHKVWFGRISVERDPLTMGGAAGAVAEDLEIEFVVWAPVRGSDQQDAGIAESRAETILASVEAAIRTDSDLGVVMFTELDSFESLMDYDEQGAAAVITGTIRAEANL